ncbi:hypothetical protein AB0K51_06455 [Kitasatospora sp. NPDC049285]|uniref:hypothetical protein n=1 Tax=Kitasatospora sp. NPDC049285 TaxID=3157096 RepID=UPI00343068BC
MSYELNALLATAELLAVVAAEVPAARMTRLSHDLALIPMTDELFDALQQPSRSADFGFKRFPDGFGLRIAAWSKSAPIAYVETDAEHSGTPGGQRAAAWYDGRVVLGPIDVATGDPAPAAGRPLDQVLRHLGVPVRADQDPCRVVGLHRYRPRAA